ncbi:MAG TPA: flagellar FliJ family protein [Egibacteraceae bacterium]|nr:flagellar FliJ family protein [Egibacteraceae bacterium]
MKRYEFRMAKVLRVRRLQEEAAQAQVAAARQAEHAAAEDLAASRQHYADLDAPAQYTAAGLLGWHARADLRAQAVTHAGRRHLTAVDSTRGAVEAWQAAQRRVEVLERLDERRREEHTVVVRRAEDATVDDIMVARSRRSA